ncbi:MAG: CDP-alcohol phosphatidyltransferase family protein, partial [Candidatus Odyssella sp.]|nr:CDP-alcohol phosphatidyltransferase family protein [Candidatus Odyssella sp.]
PPAGSFYMASLYDLKPRFQALLRPLSRGLLGAGVAPNAVTLAALALSAAMGAALALWPASAWALAAVPLVLLVRMALNALDGMMAREGGQESKLGLVLNEVGDILADGAIYLPLALALGVHALLAAGFVLLAAASEAAGLAGIATGAGRRYDGPFGKSDRAAALGALAIVAAAGVPLAGWIGWAFAALCALAALTIANRTTKAARGRA